MHKFIIKNTNDFSMYLEDLDGNIMRLRPDESFYYTSEDEDLHPVLEQQYQNGNINYWRIRIQSPQPIVPGVWKHDGF